LKVTRRQVKGWYEEVKRRSTNNPPHLHCRECLEDFNCNIWCVPDPREGICYCYKCGLDKTKVYLNSIKHYVKCYKGFFSKKDIPKIISEFL